MLNIQTSLVTAQKSSFGFSAPSNLTFWEMIQNQCGTLQERFIFPYKSSIRTSIPGYLGDNDSCDEDGHDVDDDLDFDVDGGGGGVDNNGCGEDDGGNFLMSTIKSDQHSDEAFFALSDLNLFVSAPPLQQTGFC